MLCAKAPVAFCMLRAASPPGEGRMRRDGGWRSRGGDARKKSCALSWRVRRREGGSADGEEWEGTRGGRPSFREVRAGGLRWPEKNRDQP